MDPRNPPQVLVHFYRASVQHADTWRRRLDATTNWAVVTTAAVITFSFGGRQFPHFVVLLALVFDVFFLFMEARRYQAYNLWQRRIRGLHRHLVAPALRAPEQADPAGIREGWERLAMDLGRSVPALPLWAALGYRIRRNYGPLVTVVILTWTLKLYLEMEPTERHVRTMIRNAEVGLVPGSWIAGGVAIFFLVLLWLAIRAPTEQMRDWSTLPAPIERIGQKLTPGEDELSPE